MCDKSIFQKLTVFGCVLLMIISATGCSSKKGEIHSSPYKLGELTSKESGIVAENDLFSLAWDKDRACVKFTEKNSGKVWSTTPYDYYLKNENTGKSAVMMQSPVYLEYIDSELSNMNTAYAYTGSVNSGNISSKKIENGISVTYYFDDVSISVTVDYLLKDDCLSVSVDPTKITESGSKLFSISLTPFLCSTVNSKDNYLFIPSGSGSLMYTDVREAVGREFSGMIYGEDEINEHLSSITNIQDIRMPYFGVKDGKNALCAIVQNGSELASIEAVAGENEYGFSSVFAKFYVRGFDRIEQNVSRNLIQKLVKTSDSVRTEPFSVAYYPISGESASYVGMAKTYRKYITDTYSVKDKSSNGKILNLNLFGGMQVQKNIAGIPYNTIISLTDYNSAYNIIDDIIDGITDNVEVTLTGYGKYGMSTGKIKKGFVFNKKLGSDSERQRLCDLLKEKNLPMAFSYDIMHFNKSESGVWTLFDAAKSTTRLRSVGYPISKISGSVGEGDTSYLLSRDRLTDVSEKLIKFANENAIKSVDLQSIGDVAYSDYDKTEYYARAGILKDIKALISDYQKDDIRVTVHDANSYAAVLADRVIDAPTFSANYDCFDEDVPAYSIVFKGITSLVSSPINDVDNKQLQFLRTLESGNGLSFNLINSFESKLSEKLNYNFYNYSYSVSKGAIAQMVESSKDFLSAVIDQPIKDNSVLKPGVHKTTFEDGTEIIVNYNGHDVMTSDGKVGSMNYLLKKEK